MRHSILVGCVLIAAGCKKDTLADADPSPLLDVEETESFVLDGLTMPVYVVRTEGSVPHIYAANRQDLGRVQGFVLARDRFFMMDMSRRLSSGTVSELLGDAALETDMESRGTGMSAVAGAVLGELDDEQKAMIDAFAAGVNDYIDLVTEGELPPPSEYELAATLLGANDPFELMEYFDDQSVAAMTATVVYELGFETGDASTALHYLAMDGHFAGTAFEQHRSQGLYDDVWGRIEPVFPVSSAPDWGTSGDISSARTMRWVPHVPEVVRDRLSERLKRINKRLRRDKEVGFGSNAWAVMGSASTDGRSLLAGDGHLPLTVPSLFYQIGLDTRHFGEGDIHQMGLVIPGLPFMAVGTNGNVAWSQTQLAGDITDWYVEELRLDEAGLPAETLFQGEWQTLVAVPEVYRVADVPAFGSVGRTETWNRYTTFDGRWIAEIEGREGGPDEILDDDESLINLQGTYIVPGDVDGDGVITAVSFDYVGLDGGAAMVAVDAFGTAEDVWDVRSATRGLVAYSQNIVASDSTGSVLYTGYQPVPCRDYLPRDENNDWIDGAHPQLLLDGTQYGGFTIPTLDGWVYETSDRPDECVVPFDEYPQLVDPDVGYVITANNDIGNIATDGSLLDDPWYVGGPWNEGYRGDTIDQRLAEVVNGGTADIDAMVDIQGDHQSRLGENFTPWLLESLAAARAAANGNPQPGSPEERMAAMYLADQDGYDEVESRLSAWSDAGFPARSGVETFYHQPEPGDQEHAVATMIFNAWMSYAMQNVFDDEAFPDVWRPSSGTGKTRLLNLMLDGRGPANSTELSSWNSDLEESVFFDILGTDEVESSQEVALVALDVALAMLRGPDAGTGYGGFDTEEMDEWLWGLRHWMRFDSILAELLSDSGFETLTEPFSITPDLLPLADTIGVDDPRLGLPGFPRHADQYAVDAANPGWSGTSFGYGSGPVFRMVIALGPDGAEGVNMLPGGQSGLVDSEYFADQAALWLGNETWPMRITVDDVVEGATGRESYWPSHHGAP